MEINLPTKKRTATYGDPLIMLFYGPPKVGKTTVLSQLDDCLIIDLEDGTKYLDSMRVQVIGLKKPLPLQKGFVVFRVPPVPQQIELALGWSALSDNSQ